MPFQVGLKTCQLRFGRRLAEPSRSLQPNSRLLLLLLLPLLLCQVCFGDCAPGEGWAIFLTHDTDLVARPDREVIVVEHVF